MAVAAGAHSGWAAQSHLGVAAKRHKNDRERTPMNTNKTSRKGKTNEPQMNQPSREAMAGKLQIYADRGRNVRLVQRG
jgi:hypothetical protein